MSRIAFANLAPRGSEVKRRFENGSPFGYWQIGSCLLVSSYNEPLLGTLARFGLLHRYRIISAEPAVRLLVESGTLSTKQSELKLTTQFRSKDLVPDLVALLVRSGELPGEDVVPDRALALPVGSLLGWDEHGNAKINAFPDEIGFRQGARVRLSAAGAEPSAVPCFERLSSVPTGVAALTVGSQRIGESALVELVVGAGSARKRFASENWVSGDPILDLALA